MQIYRYCTMASACSRFRPNLWRSTTCANCFFPEARHAIPELEAGLVQTEDPQVENPYSKPMSQLPPETEGRQVGVVKPYAIVEIPEEFQRRNSEPSLRQHSVLNPPRSRFATVSLSEKPHLVQRTVVGPRSHFATVSLSEEQTARRQPSSTELLGKRGSTNLITPLNPSNIVPKGRAPPRPSRPHGKPSYSLKAEGCTKTGTKLSSSHPVRKKDTVEQPDPVVPRARARTVASSGTAGVLRRKKVPPQKPPRTLSTFITSAEQEALLQQLRLPLPTPGGKQPLGPQQSPGDKRTLGPQQSPGAGGKQPLGPQQSPGDKRTLGSQQSSGGNRLPPRNRHSYSEYVRLSEPQHSYCRGSRLSLPHLLCSYNPEPSVIQHAQNTSPSSVATAPASHSRSGSCSSDATPPPSLFVSPGQLHSEISQLMMATLHAVSEGGAWGKLCQKQLWGCQWQDFKILSPTLVSHNGIPLSLEGAPQVLQEAEERELALSHLLKPHSNISLVRTLLATPPSPAPIPIAARYILRDCIDGGPLCDVLREKRRTLPSHEYTELVLLSLVQVFAGLLHLYNSGACHRDLGLDCMHTTLCGPHHLIRITNFCYALHRPGPITATTFVYGYHELKWLGGTDSRLPPEIMDTPENAQTLDYSHTDCFSAGCLLYEMMGQENPFEQDSGLVYSHYSEQNLPPLFPSTTVHPSHLQRLAELLLQRLPASRPALSTALLLSQALLWLPQQWTREPVSEVQVRQHLDYQRAQEVAALARDSSATPPLPMLLKARFLASCDVLELIRALSLFSHNHV